MVNNIFAAPRYDAAKQGYSIQFQKMTSENGLKAFDRSDGNVFLSTAGNLALAKVVQFSNGGKTFADWSSMKAAKGRSNSDEIADWNDRDNQLVNFKQSSSASYNDVGWNLKLSSSSLNKTERADYGVSSDRNGVERSQSAANWWPGAFAGSSSSSTPSVPPVNQQPEPPAPPTPEPTPQAAIIALRLINAETGEVVPGFENIEAGEVIDKNLLNLNTLTFEVLGNSAMKSVKMEFTSGSLQKIVRTESWAPYAMAGDANGVFNPTAHALGAQTFRATPYAEANASGAAGSAFSVQFTIADSTPRINAIRLINTDTNKVVAGYENISSGVVIDKSTLKLKNLSFEAIVNDEAKSVKFEFSSPGKSKNTRVENQRPFHLGGDTNGKVNAVPYGIGSQVLKVSTFSQLSAQGEAGDVKEISFKIQE